jgi:hypothetical protein
MIDAGRSWRLTRQSRPVHHQHRRCHSSFPAPESRVVYANSGMDLAAAIRSRQGGGAC